MGQARGGATGVCTAQEAINQMKHESLSFPRRIMSRTDVHDQLELVWSENTTHFGG
jgi:hypothetical protein